MLKKDPITFKKIPRPRDWLRMVIHSTFLISFDRSSDQWICGVEKKRRICCDWVGSYQTMEILLNRLRETHISKLSTPFFGPKREISHGIWNFNKDSHLNFKCQWPFASTATKLNATKENSNFLSLKILTVESTEEMKKEFSVHSINKRYLSCKRTKWITLQTSPEGTSFIYGNLTFIKKREKKFEEFVFVLLIIFLKKNFIVFVLLSSQHTIKIRKKSGKKYKNVTTENKNGNKNEKKLINFTQLNLKRNISSPLSSVCLSGSELMFGSQSFNLCFRYKMLISGRREQMSFKQNAPFLKIVSNLAGINVCGL